MNSGLLLALVLLATFALAGLALTAMLALLWRAGLRHVPATALDLLGLRLLPAAGGLLAALTIALPAFLSYEPPREHELAGPLLIALAALAAACLAHGVWRGARACLAARALIRRYGLPRAAGRLQAQVVELAQPLVAVIGAWRPRIIAAACVREACDAPEFRAVLAHEAAHVAARDNLKLLLMLAAPDALAWTPLAAGITARWRAAAECEADQCATGGDPERRLALASGLIKVARLLEHSAAPDSVLGMSVAGDDVAGRVQRLLGPPPRPLRATSLRLLAGCALLLPLLALPHYALLHELIEQLVRL